MTPTLPDDAEAWAEAWRTRVNDSTAFAAAADGFDAIVLLVVEPDGTYDGEAVRLLVDVADGDCVAARPVTDEEGASPGAAREGDLPADAADYDYALRGPYEAWKSLLTDDVEVAETVLDGPFDVDGDTVGLLKHRDVFVEMVRSGREVDAAFAY